MQRKGAIAVTGASRGIGAAIATALAEGSHTVGCLSRTGELPAGIDARFESRMISQDIEFLSGETIYIDGAQGVAH